MPKKTIIIIVSVVVIIALVTTLFLVLKPQKPQKIATPAADKASIGSIDQELIFNLPEFQKARSTLMEKGKALETQFSSKAKSLSQSQQVQLQQLFQQKFADEQKKAIQPVLDRLKKAIEAVAKEEDMILVIDSQIIIVGSKDITSKVINKFKEEGEIKIPAAKAQKDMNIGYVNQTDITEHPKYQKASKEYQEMVAKYQKQWMTEAAKLKTNEEKQKLLLEYEAKVAQEEKQIVAPVREAVNKAVSQTAKEKNLSIVLNKQDVFFGGKDITEDVKKKL